MQFNKIIVRLATFAVLVVVPALSACAADSSGAHVFARHGNGTNIVSRLVPDGTDVATAGMISSFAQYYPDGSVKSSAEFTPGIKYNFDTTNHTATVKPFCDTDTADNDNSSLIGRVVIPPYVDEHGNPYVADDGTRFKVTAVTGDDGQSENTNLTAIVAPTSVVDIGYGGAFDACAALVSVTFPSVTNVGYRAFYSCTALVSVKIPNATDIGVDSFSHCYKLASVSLPAATSVGDYAFSNCGALTSVSLPAATSVGNFSFNYCRGLTSVDFGDTPRSSVPTLGTDAFRYVQTPCKIIVPYTQYDAWIAADGWKNLPQEFVRHAEKADKPATFTTGNLAKFDSDGNPMDSGLSKDDVESLFFAQYYPEGNVKSTAEFTLGIKYDDPDEDHRTITVKPFCNTGTATNDNSSLYNRVVIPPFVDAQGNPYIADDGTRYKVVGVSAAGTHTYSTNLTAIVAPNTVMSIGSYAFYDCDSLASVSLPGATSIGDRAFQECTTLASVSAPAATSIGDSAFHACPALASVSLPAATYIGSMAFYGCAAIESVSLPAATDIGAYAFKSCSALASVSLPAAVSTGDHVFESCTNLVSVSLPDAKRIGAYAFSFCSALASVSLPAATNIRISAFSPCSSLVSVSLPSATSIDGGAFRSCGNLATVSLPAATSIGFRAFESCTSLASISLPVATYIDRMAFYGCAALASVSLPAATDIGDNAFDDCTSLASVSLPAATNIEYYAFSSCPNLVSVSLPAATSIGEGVFGFCDSLASISLPSVTSIENYSFPGCPPLALVDFGATLSSVPSLGEYVFGEDPANCKIIVPDALYDVWIATNNWSTLYAEGYQFMKHSEWEYARRYEVAAKADKPATFTAGNLAALNSNGNPTDSGLSKDDVESLFFAKYYPDGNVKSAAEFTQDIKYTLTSNATERTATVKPFCNTGVATNDNSILSGRVVIPPFVDGDGNPYISDDGTRFKVVGVGSGTDSNNSNENLTAVIAPSTVANIEDKAFRRCTKLASVSTTAATSIGSGAFSTCTSLASVSLPAVDSIGIYAFNSCTKLASVSIPAATNIQNYAFYSCTKLTSVSIPAAKRIGGHVFDGCTKLASVSLPAATSVGGSAFNNCNSLVSVSLHAVTSIDGYSFAGCTSLTSVDFGATLSSVSTLGSNAFNNVPKSCKIIVPDAQYDAWTTANLWKDLVTAGYKFLKHSEWEYARKVDVSTLAYNKADVTRAGAPQFGTNDFWTCWDGTVLRCDTDRTGDFGGYSQAVWVGTNTASSIWRYQYPTETMLKYSCEKATGDYEWTCEVKYLSGSYAGEYVTYAVDVGGVTQYVYPEVLSESPSGWVATNIDFGVSYPEDGVELHLPIIRKADATVVYSDQLADVAKVAGRAVRTPDYNNTNNHFYASASDATSALAGFGDVGTNTWTTTRSGIGYLRMASAQSNGPTVRLYVNEVDDAHMLFVWGSPNRDIVVPVFLRAGDSLKLHVDGSQPLSYVQFSMFYTD